jgi:hypothetical protein
MSGSILSQLEHAKASVENDLSRAQPKSFARWVARQTCVTRRRQNVHALKMTSYVNTN